MLQKILGYSLHFCSVSVKPINQRLKYVVRYLSDLEEHVVEMRWYIADSTTRTRVFIGYNQNDTQSVT